MAAGPLPVADGCGFRDRSVVRPIYAPALVAWVGGAPDLTSRSEWEWDGSRWLPEKYLFRATV
jgi:hypothetical protein